MLILIIIFLVTVNIRLEAEIDKLEINIEVLWLEPFIRAFISIKEGLPALKLFLFDRLAYSKKIKRRSKKKVGTELIKYIKLKDIQVNVDYGFADPFTTGIACGVANIASQLVNVDSVVQNPDFVSDNDYMYLTATAKVNVGMVLLNFIKGKIIR